MADLVTVIDADRAKSSLTYCLNAFITAGLSSDMWRDHRLCTAPLEWMKKEVASQTESKPNSNLSSSINRVYLALLEQFGVKSIDRPEAHIFLRRKRLHSVGNSGLRWCFEPNKKNTRLAKKILGREVTSVPWFVQNLAREFEETLRYFEVIHVKQIEAGLNAFLIYVMTLDEADAPKNLVEIDREKHINDLSEHGNTFRNFLTDNFSESGRDCGSRAMGTVQKAWRFSSELNGFGKTIANPIDMSTDNPIKYRKKGAKSTRHAIMDEVFQIILWENVRDDYAFARTLDFLYQTVRLPGSDVFKRLFWPAQPLILEACARSATRGKSARFADSGEGDEFRYDPDLLQMVVNTGKHATVGRQMGLIQSMAIFTDGGRREVPTLYVASGKTGDYAVPYVDPDFARRFTEFTRLQEEYNPVDGASLALDTRHHSDHSYLGEVANVYVAFRELNLGYVTAISPERITSYLVALLTHCEPIVEKALGYPYPLVRDGNPLIQLHAFRVTANTRLQARGGTREDARILLGHKTALYADYYNNPPLVDNYTRIANAAAL
ncbi:VPA1269 family protein, partial [Rhizobium phaseoli]